MNVPKSQWIIEKVFFKVKLVDNFKSEYIGWMSEVGHDHDDLDMLKFIENVTNQDTVELYQFPSQKPWDNDDSEQDYFERLDDNHVIPRILFELI